MADLDETLMPPSAAEQATQDEQRRRQQAEAIRARPPGPPVPGQPTPPPQHIEDPAAAGENPQITQADAASSARLAAQQSSRPAGPPTPSNSFITPNGGLRISEVPTPGQPTARI